ncbi:MAG: four helix bundle protein [Bacteroidales bacterium]|jgi:four helix bundle protein|nr:four helix bundle protein [Bacteroidales bacterium]MDD4384369.1 four helix bundle protein [Bacteroidales bacterium]MDY0198760.1 four helix bundle protein [Tenuifilaceae bacterium]
MDEPRIYDLEERLISFALQVLEVSEILTKTYAGNHISGQIIRSGTSPALNYGEAQAAESSKDFIHKMGIILKELRETSISLMIIIRKPLASDINVVQKCLNECQELIAIFASSIKTAKSRNLK